MRYRDLVARDSWQHEERRRIETALAEARHWQAIEPHKSHFWKIFWEGTLEPHYPAWKWERRPQKSITEFARGEQA